MPLSTIYHNGVRVMVFNATFYNIRCDILLKVALNTITLTPLWYIVESGINTITLTPLWYIVESGINTITLTPLWYIVESGIKH
jgi:hypothetical protein